VQWRGPKIGFGKVFGGLEWIGLLGIVMITFALTADVFARSVLNKPLLGIKELVELLLPVAWALMLAGTQAAGANVKVVFLIDRLRPRNRVIVDLLVLFLSLVFFGVLAWQSGIVAWESWLRREYIMAGIEYPLYPTRAAVFIGCLLLGLQILKEMLQTARRIGSKPEKRVTTSTSS
jgi:TRAP-type C4-dicarboxylate transport system permease small subunit